MAADCGSLMTTSNDDKRLEGLLDAFGDVFSLEDIASAYCQAGKDAHLAAEFLYKSDGDGYSSSFASCGSSSETRSVDSLDGSFVMVRDKSNRENSNMKREKQNWRPVSMGTVSGHLSKDYVSSKPLKNGSPCLTKISKVQSRYSPTSYGYESNLRNKNVEFRKKPLMGKAYRDLGEDYVSPNPFKNGSSYLTYPLEEECQPQPLPRLQGCESTLGKKNKKFGNKEMEDFLFDLLGAGFNLDRSQIQTVLGQCGYNIQKSMQELLNISAENSARSCSNTRKPSRDSVNMQRRHSGPSRNSRDEVVAVNNSDTEISDAFRSKIDREMEVLAALFTPGEITSELPRRSGKVKDFTSSNAATGVVDLAEGYSDELKTDSTCSWKDDDVDADLKADDFQVLRRAVKDYLVTKKEYYRAAVEAHAKGDHARAAKLVEQGEFFHQKARQADDESVQKIFEIRPNAKKPDDTLILDLHECGPKEAIRLLQCHLPMLSAFRYYTLIINTNDKDVTKGSRKRKIIKLLKEQSIEWIQGTEAGTILISTNKFELDKVLEGGASVPEFSFDEEL